MLLIKQADCMFYQLRGKQSSLSSQ